MGTENMTSFSLIFQSSSMTQSSQSAAKRVQQWQSTSVHCVKCRGSTEGSNIFEVNGLSEAFSVLRSLFEEEKHFALSYSNTVVMLCCVVFGSEFTHCVELLLWDSALLLCMGPSPHSLLSRTRLKCLNISLQTDSQLLVGPVQLKMDQFQT